MAPDPDQRFIKLRSSTVDMYGVIVLFVGDPEQGPPREVMTKLKRRGTYARTTADFPACSFLVATPSGEVPTVVRRADSLSLANLQPDEDAIVVPLRVPQTGNLYVADTLWERRRSWDEQSEPAELALPDLTAGDYEVLVRARGRDGRWENLDVTIHACDSPTLRVERSASTFMRTLTEDPTKRVIPDGTIRCGGAHRLNFITGEALSDRSPRFMTSPVSGALRSKVREVFQNHQWARLADVDKNAMAAAMGDSVGGGNEEAPEFAVFLAGNARNAHFPVTVHTHPERPTVDLAATDDMTTAVIFSETGTLSFFNFDRELSGTVDVGEPGPFGMFLVAHRRDEAWSDRSRTISPESWDVHVWPVELGHSVEKECAANTHLAQLHDRYGVDENVLLDRVLNPSGNVHYLYAPFDALPAVGVVIMDDAGADLDDDGTMTVFYAGE